MKMYQVDAFAKQIFEGNPAAVVPLEEWIPAKNMQQIAQENNLSETAFFVPSKKGFQLRWFTPNTEVDLCGHATMAAAHVLFEHLDFQDKTIVFETKSGILKVSRNKKGYLMDFPADPAKQIDGYSALETALEMDAIEIWKGKTDYLVLLENEAAVANLKPNMSALAQLAARGVIVTAEAASDKYDFISRFFAPQCDVDEDPVTGSAHTTLSPFWAARLNKNELFARQISTRGGDVHCSLQGDRVQLRGNAVTFMIGEILDAS